MCYYNGEKAVGVIIMISDKEKFLQTLKETICALDGHQYVGGEVRTEHLQEYETTCFIFKCGRCGYYVACAIKDSALNYTYPLEIEFDFN